MEIFLEKTISFLKKYEKALEIYSEAQNVCSKTQDNILLEEINNRIAKIKREKLCLQSSKKKLPLY